MNNKSIIKIKDGKVGMIGYGMLSSLESVEDVLGRKYHDEIFCVHLNGLQRAWNFVGANNDPNLPSEYLKYDSFFLRNQETIPFEKSIFLNIVENKEVQLNCALYFVTLDELEMFDELEVGYKRIDVTDIVKEYNFENGKIYAYKALPAYEFNPEMDSDKSIIDKGYLDLVLASYDTMGSEHRKEYDLSTIPPDPYLVAPVIHKKVRE
ncbi:hypothetical protein DHD32_12425 [Arenibacter sp. TNZ]|uniref:hypothetical protein n=1 Tax=Arenibacter TaxID=178469 RepID=UPI000CD42FC1|nr:MULTISPECIES: hypothetical protein [Arenibacter]MCM4172291.1 hypothetical protein [Arenibacter sp. TNZ]